MPVVATSLPARTFPSHCGPRRGSGRFAMLAVLVAAVAAGEAPVETTAATELTVEQAQTIVAEAVARGGNPVVPNVATLSAEVAAVLAGSPGLLHLPDLASITPEVAETLATHDGSGLNLPGLKSLPPRAAQAFARYRGSVLLQGLTTLPADSAELLAEKKEGGLLVDGFTTLDPRAAAALARCPNWNGELKSLKTLTPETAEALASRRDGLTLGVNTLEPAAAQALAKHEGRVSIPGLAILTPEAAEALAACRGWDGQARRLHPLTTDVAAALAKRPGPLSFKTVLSADAATALAAHAGDLSLSFSETNPLTAEVANALSGHRGRLVLEAIPSLTPEIARSLLTLRGDLTLRGCDLTPDAADVIASFPQRLRLEFMGKQLSPAAAQALAAFKGQKLTLDSLGTPEDAVIEALAANDRVALKVRYWPMLSAAGARLALQNDGGLSNQPAGLRTIATGMVTPAGAAILADCPETISFRLLTESIPPEVAKELSRFRGRRLEIRNIRSIEAEAFAALASNPRISTPVGALSSLSVATAELLAARSGPLSLPGITGLESPDSIDIARALARKKDYLALPNLRRLSPRTLAALIEKQDVRIPLIESLELINEPDGSRTEDFVVPESFQQQPLQR
jgi:hypothetical protein